MDLIEIESAGQECFIRDSDLQSMDCEALVAIAEPTQHHPFLGRERVEKTGVDVARIQRLIDDGQSSRVGAMFIRLLER